MGIPANPDSTQPPQPSAPTADPQTANAGMPTADSTQTPSDPSALPPAALELAAKLFDLARDGRGETLTQYLQAGIPPNLTNHSGDTLLMLGAYHGHAHIVQLMLDKGADPNAINSRGQSPLAGAVFKGHDDVIRLLFENGGDIRAGTPTAVQTARMFRNTPILDLFGVDVANEPPLPGQVPTGPGMGSTSTEGAAQGQGGPGAS